MSEAHREMKVFDPKTKISLSPRDLLLGLGACLVAVVLGMRVFVMLAPLFLSSNSAEAGFNLGGVAILGIFTVAIFKWGMKRFQSITIEEAIEALKDKKAENRRRAASALKRSNWTPESEDQHLDLFVAGEEWEKVTSFGQRGIQRVIDTLSWEGSFLPDKLKALAKSRNPSAVKPLIEILNSNISVGYKGEVVKALKELTGKDLRNYKQWQEWWEKNKERFGKEK